MMIVQRLRQWAKAGNSPLARNLWSTAKALRTWSCPVIPAIHRPLYALHQLLKMHSHRSLAFFTGRHCSKPALPNQRHTYISTAACHN
ncbi:hypothetical protein PCI56_02920 [Plesiomonas shigelloides subsp. oncorhynchi]|nr:hypothetical protein [Plesiomonas shigelloides]